MKYALIACTVVLAASSGTAFAQAWSPLPRNWTPSRAVMAAAWATDGKPAPVSQPAPSSWEALRGVPSGTMLRVGYGERGNAYVEVEGELVEWQPDAIQVGTRQPKRIGKAQVRSVRRLDARRNRAQRAAIGALVGFGLGFALGYAGSPRDAGAAPPAVAGFLVGGAFGGVGALVRSGKYHSVLVYSGATR